MSPAEIFEESLQQAKKIRQRLHSYPEISGQEKQTHDYLLAYLSQFSPDGIHAELGESNTGLVVEFNSGKPGPTLMLRADTDALPIQETPDTNCVSKNAGHMHACGHDGHTAMLAGLAPWLHYLPITKGRLLLLFQPAEETGQGAKSLLQDPRFLKLEPDYIFGLHNLPGRPLGHLYTKDETFCFASTGLNVRLKGYSSHAAEKELAHSPAFVLSELISYFHPYPSTPDFKLTLTHAQLGEPSFGICPGEATLFLTLRAFSDALLAQQKDQVIASLQKIANQNQLRLHCEEVEPFPATRNDKDLHTFFTDLATKRKLPIHFLDIPFYWSEDFGHYSRLAPTYFFGLGAGEQTKALPHPAYQFPDALLAHGFTVWQTLILHFLHD